jgi:chemotaxis protein methyltransferase CheR
MSDAELKEIEPPPGEAQSELEVELLLEAIYGRYHYDFRRYARASLRRRLAQAVIRLGCRTVSGLQEKILHHPESFAALLQHLTVPVSEMFRDPPYFLEIRSAVLPLLATYPSLKIWVAGCSTGEEAYSLAIALAEEGLLERSLVYATDINGESLRRAEAGIFPLERVRGFSESHRQAGGKRALSEYYHAAHGAVRMDPALRRRITFSDHDLATDGVFSEVQLVSCRNVLIYFDRQLQERALGLFADALCSRGFLGLGPNESLRFSALRERFEPFRAPVKIFRRTT